MPLVLVPLVGAAPVVPIIAISAMFTNTARVAAFRRSLDRRGAVIALIAALPTCVLGAWLYTLLTGRGAALVGGTTGAGVIMLSLLMATGLEGAAVIATDAAVSLGMGVVKIAVFGSAGVLTSTVIVIALLIGLVAFPCTFLAKVIVERLPVHVHTVMLDAVVVIGGSMMIFGALR